MFDSSQLDSIGLLGCVSSCVVAADASFTVQKKDRDVLGEVFPSACVPHA